VEQRAVTLSFPCQPRERGRVNWFQGCDKIPGKLDMSSFLSQAFRKLSKAGPVERNNIEECANQDANDLQAPSAMQAQTGSRGSAWGSPNTESRMSRSMTRIRFQVKPHLHTPGKPPRKRSATYGEGPRLYFSFPGYICIYATNPLRPPAGPSITSHMNHIRSVFLVLDSDFFPIIFLSIKERHPCISSRC
jgi:hypothetical protein